MSIETEAIALTRGTWRPDRGGILRWVPDTRDGIIVCPKCEARFDETCRTRNGNRTHDHPERTIPRKCPCGGSLKPRRLYCESCKSSNKKGRDKARRAAA